MSNLPPFTNKILNPVRISVITNARIPATNPTHRSYNGIFSTTSNGDMGGYARW